MKNKVSLAYQNRNSLNDSLLFTTDYTANYYQLRTVYYQLYSQLLSTTHCLLHNTDSFMPASHCLWLTAVYEAINMLQSYFELCQNIDSKVTIQTPVSVWLCVAVGQKGIDKKKKRNNLEIIQYSTMSVPWLAVNSRLMFMDFLTCAIYYLLLINMCIVKSIYVYIYYMYYYTPCYTVKSLLFVGLNNFARGKL